MKKITAIFCVLVLLFSLTACTGEKPDTEEYTFKAKVLEVNGDTLIVEPLKDEDEYKNADKISFSIKDFDIKVAVGDTVKITYNGVMRESYPVGITASDFKLIKSAKAAEKYAGEWLNKETAQSYEGSISEHLIITEIYADCFFARSVVPMPNTYKINGDISEDWCVEDKVLVTFDNRYEDAEGRAEGDLIEIKESDFELDPNVDYKPVIYLYPQKETAVSVKLKLNGKLTCTYPEYNGGWNVTASPDGTLTDESGMTYNYLYWEGETYNEWDMSKGFCVKGEDTAAFLESALQKLGLNRREANEFIVFWLPLMQNNPYNIISFQTDAYTDAAKLDITPTPDTLIRVFMVYKPSDEFINIPSQELSAPERSGFTAIEWGGTQIKNN